MIYEETVSFQFTIYMANLFLVNLQLEIIIKRLSSSCSIKKKNKSVVCIYTVALNKLFAFNKSDYLPIFDNANHQWIIQRSVDNQ